MNKITKKYIFEQKLKGAPIYIYVDEITDDEIRCLLDCGVIEQFAKSPRRLCDLNLVLALYPVVNAIPRRFRGNISYEFRDVPPCTGKLGSVVKLHDKSLIYNGL